MRQSSINQAKESYSENKWASLIGDNALCENDPVKRHSENYNSTEARS